MSWTDLKTDYTDAQFTGLRKYQMIENGDDTISFRDVTEYTQHENSFFAAGDANAMNAAVNAIMHGENVAAQFNAQTAYSVGDYVFYDGTLYRFTAAHTGAWNASHAVVVLITSELMSKLTDAPSDGSEYVRKNGAWVVPAGSGAATWGSISGTLADQTDLQTALNGKAASSHTHSYNSLTGKPTLGAMAAEADAPSDSKEYVRKNGNWVESSGGGSGAATWGSISGTLANQTDLKNALDAKANTADLGDLADHDQVDYETEVTNKPSTFPPAPHIHDDRYYTESETDALLDGKAPVIIGPVPVKLSGTYIVVPVGARPIDFKATLQVTQTGSGTPSAVNVRPFESADSCIVVIADSYGDIAATMVTRNISLPSTIYGGVVDVINGKLTITYGHIASYNGETLPGVWYSDRDVYASGTTPTIGAEVVYELETPIEQTCSSYTPTMFSSRDTYLWASHQSQRLSVTNYTVAGAIDIYEQEIIDTKTYIDQKDALKANVTDLADESKLAHHTYYVKGTQTASTGSWTGDLPEVDALFEGLSIDYYLPYAGTGNASLNLTLKDGVQTGAVPCYVGAASRLTTHIGAYQICRLTYQTVTISNVEYTGWYLIRSIDFNDMAQNIRNGIRLKSDSVIYRFQLLFFIDADTVTPLNNINANTATSKAMLTNVNFNPFSRIYYWNATSTWDADSIASSTSNLYYQQLGIDLRYSINCGSTLTANELVYLKVIPQSNGMVRLAPDPCWAQELPTTADGYWYILLGRAYNTYQLSLYPDHPVYYHDGTRIMQAQPPNMALTGTPTAPTPASGDDSTRIATTEWVTDALVAGFRDVYKVTLPSASSSKLTFSAPGITANHVLCVEGHAYYSNPSAVMSELSITTAANSITITGTLSGTTDIIVTLGIPRTITAS